jgi:flagellar hook assembly protein FlgD
LLRQNRPNPFKQRTVINFQLSMPGHVSIIIYNVAGQRVRTLVDQFQVPGYHVESWDGRDDRARALASGVYVYRLQAGGASAVRRMTMIR